MCRSFRRPDRRFILALLAALLLLITVAPAAAQDASLVSVTPGLSDCRNYSGALVVEIDVPSIPAGALRLVAERTDPLGGATPTSLTLTGVTPGLNSYRMAYFAPPGTAPEVPLTYVVTLFLDPPSPTGPVANLGSMTLTFTCPMHAPVAHDDSATTQEEIAVIIDVTANDSDEDNNLNPATVAVIPGPALGTAVANGDGTITYTPDEDNYGVDSFNYEVCDSDGNCAEAAVTVTIEPVNDLPMLSADRDPVVVDEGQMALNTGFVSDNDGDNVLVTAFPFGIAINNGDGTWSWSYGTTDGPAQNSAITISADDGNSGLSAVSFGLTVNNVAPSVNAGADALINAGDAYTVNATFTDPGTADTHGAAIDFGLGDGLQPAALIESAGSGAVSGTQSYPNAGAFTLMVCVADDDGAFGCDALVLTVQAVSTPEPTAEPTAEPTVEPTQEPTPPPAEPTIADRIIGAAAGDPAEYTILLAALQAADPAILTLLDDPAQSLTLFAPTDAAFNAMLAARGLTVEQWLAETAALNDLLRYHIVPGQYDTATLFSRAVAPWPSTYIRTLQGSYVEFTDDEGTLIVDAAWVVAADAVASNGLVHSLGAVLDPAYVYGEEGLP